MSQVNHTVPNLPRRDVRRVLTVVALVAAMGAVAAYQLRQEAVHTSRVSSAAPRIEPQPPARPR